MSDLADEIIDILRSRDSKILQLEIENRKLRDMIADLKTEVGILKAKLEKTSSG